MNKRKCKKLFYKESAKWLLKRGWTDGYISPNTIKYVVRKLEKLTKLKLLYYLHNKVEEDCFVIATGGVSHVYKPLTEKIHVADRLHTLKGLYYLGRDL